MAGVRSPRWDLLVTVAVLVSVQSVFALAQTVPDSEDVLGSDRFDDVPVGHESDAAIGWAFDTGITRGKSESVFGFNDDLKRSEFVTFLCRAVTKARCAGDADHPFVDTAGYEWADFSIAWAYDNRITAGISSTEFGPHQLLTKEQALTFLHRAVGAPTPLSVEEREAFLMEYGLNGYTSFHRSDMDSGAYYYTAMVWAGWKGVFNGETLQTYGIGSNVPRGQAVLWLCRVFGPGTNTCLYGNFPSEWDSGRRAGRPGKASRHGGVDRLRGLRISGAPNTGPLSRFRTCTICLGPTTIGTHLWVLCVGKIPAMLLL